MRRSRSTAKPKGESPAVTTQVHVDGWPPLRHRRGRGLRTAQPRRRAERVVPVARASSRSPRCSASRSSSSRSSARSSRLGGRCVTSPTLLALLFLQKYPDRVKLKLVPKIPSDPFVTDRHVGDPRRLRSRTHRRCPTPPAPPDERAPRRSPAARRREPNSMSAHDTHPLRHPAHRPAAPRQLLRRDPPAHRGVAARVAGGETRSSSSPTTTR